MHYFTVPKLQIQLATYCIAERLKKLKDVDILLVSFNKGIERASVEWFGEVHSTFTMGVDAKRSCSHTSILKEEYDILNTMFHTFG